MKNLFKKFKRGTAGATAIEYGLIAALIAVVLISTLGTLGTNLNTKFSAVKNGVASR